MCKNCDVGCGIGSGGGCGGSVVLVVVIVRSGGSGGVDEIVAKGPKDVLKQYFPLQWWLWWW